MNIRALLDDRARGPGVGRFATCLIEALETLEDPPELVLTSGRIAASPFTPWGRMAVGKMAASVGASLVHGLHFETPRTGLPTLVTVQDMIPLEHPSTMPNPIRRWLFSQIVRDTFARASIVAVPSRLSAVHAEKHGCPPNKITVIPLGADPRFRPLTDEERAGAVSAFGDGGAYVSCLASARSHKNLATLVEAARSLPDIRFVCPGQDAPPPLHPAGPLDDDGLRLLFGGSTVFVLPSLIEGFGLPALEARACGTSVICGPDVGALDILTDGVRVVDVSSSSEISKAVRDLMSEARPLGGATSWSVRDQALAYLDAYKTVIS